MYYWFNWKCTCVQHAVFQYCISIAPHTDINRIPRRSLWIKGDQNLSAEWFIFCFMSSTPLRTHTAQDWMGVFPKMCIVYRSLSYSDCAVFITLLRITNYPSLAVLKDILTPQREAIVHKLTEKKQTLSFFLNIALSFFFTIFPIPFIDSC